MNTYTSRQSGFTVVEILIGIILLGTVITSLALAFDGLNKSYAKTRELSEVYAALSGCPEIDRALQFDVIDVAHCSPNDTFNSESSGGNNDITYSTVSTPMLTSSLPTSDPVHDIPDSKVVDVTVNTKTAKQWKLRLLITRNGIGQQ